MAHLGRLVRGHTRVKLCVLVAIARALVRKCCDHEQMYPAHSISGALLARSRIERLARPEHDAGSAQILASGRASATVRAMKRERRNFLRGSAGVLASLGTTSGCAGTGLTQASTGMGGERAAMTGAPVAQLAVAPLPIVRVALVGVGARGKTLLRLLLTLEGCEVTALADIDKSALDAGSKACADAGRNAPTIYDRGEEDFRRLCASEAVDLVVVATPWRWHVPMALAAMNAGKHVAVEVPAAMTMEGCWALVETAEAAQRHCMMLENCCYGYEELMVLQMCRAGLLGDLVHAEAAYIHDLRALLFSGQSEGLWRTAHSMQRDGNLYPTHGLGPVAQYMNINRGDRLDFACAVSSMPAGMHQYAVREFGAESKPAHWKFRNGDMNTTMLRTVRGRSILVQHDTTSPRPYSRHNLVQGTKGTFAGYPPRIFIDGKSSDHQWEDIENYRERYEHPWWRALKARAQAAGGHGGMDFIMLWRLIACLRAGSPLDQNVYDAATWSAVSPLSETSVAARGRSVDAPDFTRGAWSSLPGYEARSDDAATAVMGLAAEPG